MGRDYQDYQSNVNRASGADWTLVNDDCIEGIASDVADESVDLSVYSPPFASLYTYSATERDLGNCRTSAEFFEHYAFLIRELFRVTREGRVTCVHVAQIAAMLERDGYIGMKDFRGDVIRAYLEAGWIYHGEVCIDKDPQAQAIRTKAKGLLFVQMQKDSAWSRPAMADYILIFRKPGVNAAPVQHASDNPLAALSNDEWISWARPIWYGIRESDTLQTVEAREDEDERHICPLQIGTIERCVRLYSNPGDLVLSPFAGIGSEGYVSLQWGRRFVGYELKPSYFRVAERNLRAAEAMRTQGYLFGEQPA